MIVRATCVNSRLKQPKGSSRYRGNRFGVRRPGGGTARRAGIGLLAGTVLLIIGTGCGADRTADDTTDFATELHGEVDLILGASDSAPEFEFSRISGLTADEDGRIFAADPEAAEVRVFTRSGRLAYRIGRKGQGPGELQDPCCLALRDGSLWVRDNGNIRYNVYAVDDTGEVYQRMVRMAHTDINRWAQVTFDATGNLVDIGTTPDSASQRPLETRLILDSAGGVVSTFAIPAPPDDSVPLRTVSRAAGEERIVFYLNQPYGPYALNAHGPDGERAHAITSRYSIAWHDSDGELRHMIERQHDAPGLTPGEKARAESSIVRDMRRINLSRQDIPYGIPERKQPLRSIFFDRDGRLWVELSVAAGSSRRADVYDREGRLAHIVEWPADIDLSANGAIRGSIAHGIIRDSLDVQRVVRLRLR